MRLWLLLLALVLALPAQAQDLDDEDGGRGFLTSRIENLLSGAGREVRIEGFEGALSSRATIGRLTIADDEGVWLTIEDAVFDWDRSALFDRRVEIEELSAGRIALERLPAGDDAPAPPRATAREFSLPELPVALRIDRVAADRVELGEPILGQAAVLTLEGSGRLSDGTAEVDLEARRIDDAQGVFSVAATVDPEGTGIDVDLALEEGPGGIAATTLGIPDEPALSLAARAQGVPSDLDARFTLATAGSENLTGTFSLVEEGGRRFALDARGDVAPLVGPAYRDFFGDDLTVAVEGTQGAEGGFDLSTLAVRAAELSLEGSASIAPDGLPDAFDVALTIRDGAEGVRLPVGGDVRLGSAELTATFDAAQGEVWSLAGTVSDLSTGAVDLGTVRLDGGGRIAAQAPRRVTALATVTAAGIDAADEALTQALGDEIELVADVVWSEGEPVDLRGLVLRGAGFSVSASGELEGTTFDGDLVAEVEDLSQLDALTGQTLGGAIEARLEGTVSPLSGAFDARITATGQDLSTGIEPADALIGGRAELALDAARDLEGTTLRAFSIETAALQASAEGRIAPEALDESVNLTYSARLDDVGRVVDQVSGPATLEGRVRREGLLTPPEDPADMPDGALPGRWIVTLDAEAPPQGTVVLEATVPDEGDAQVEFDADLADLEPYVAQLPGPASITGTATREGGDWRARLNAELPRDIEAMISATYGEDGALMANFDAGLADLGVFVPQLEGAARFTGRALRDAGTGDLEVVSMATLPEGIEAELIADVPAEGEARVNFDAVLPDLALFVPQLPGEARLVGTATRDEEGIEAEFDLTAPEGITARVDAILPAQGATRAQFDAEVPEVGAFTEAVSGSATLTGTAVRQDGETVVDAEVAGPEGVTARLDATLMDDTIRADVDAEIPRVEAFTGALEGPATLDATVTRAGGETTAELRLDGPQGIDATVDAVIPGEGPITADYEVDVEDVSAFAPLPEGPATVRGTATRSQEGDLSTEARVAAPAGIEADVTASLAASGDIEAEVDAVIAEPGAIREGLPGPIEADVTAARTDGTWTADADVTAPGGTALTAEVSLPPEGDAAIDFDLMLEDPAPYLNGLPGPLTATGSARRDGDGWTGELRASAEDGSRATADVALPDEGRAEVEFDAAVGDLGRFVTQLPGEATARGTAVREDGTWTGRAEVTAPAGIRASVEGSFEEGTGDAEARIDAAIGELGRFVPQLPGAAQLQGTVSRTGGAFGFDVDATGPAGTRADLEGIYDPTGPADVTFDVTLGDVGAFVDRLSGPVSAQGIATSDDGGPLVVDAALSGPAGSRTEVSGSVQRDLSSADVSIAGSAPLDLANPFIRPRALDGTARFDLALDGPLELTSLTGTVTAAGARLALPDQRVAIEGIDLSARLTGNEAVLDVTGGVSTGGRLAVEGSVTVFPPFPADLTVTAQDVVITDPQLYETSVDGQLSITGPLRGREGSVAGTLVLGETEIRIPSTGPGGSGAIPVIDHRNIPFDVRLTRERARLADVAPATRRGTPQRNAFDLDLQIVAENRIFVRGRGLDAELGGTLRLAGSTANVIPVGQFDLIRGRLDLLGRRFDFNDGSISLQGEFIPVVRLVAITETDDDTLSIILEGELNDPELRIVSAAGLPQDEAIARLLFGRDLRELSPLQAARLAAAVAELSGRGTGGVLGSLREGVGLDDLDITSSEDGTIGLRAGAYITENIYTDLSIDEEGQTQIQLNLDITDEVTVQGRTSADGETGIGVFFERDY